MPTSNKKNDYQLIHAFCNRDFFIDEKILKQFNGHLADRKVLYKKELKTVEKQSSAIFEYESNELIPELEQLAYESGKYSRFKLDKNLISACENKLLLKGINQLEAPTQAGNIQACEFYEKCGFKIEEITNIYHFWI